MAVKEVLVVSCVRVLVNVYLKTACAAVHLIIKGVVLVILGANVGQHLAEHGQEQTQTRRQVLDVGLDSHVADTVSGLVVEMHLSVSKHALFRVCEFNLFRDVTKAQSGKNLVILRLLLVTFELSSFLNNELFLSLGKRGIESLKVGFVGSFILVSLGLIGGVEHLKEVLVGGQMPLDQTLKEAAIVEFFPDPIRVLVDLKHIERVTFMESIRHHMRNIHQTGVGLGLFGSKLHLVKGLLKELLVNTVFLDILECLEEYILDLFEVVDLDTLDTHGESGLACRVVKASAWAELGRDLALNDRLVERSVGSLQEKCGQDLQAEGLVSILCGDEVAEEAQGKLGLLVCWAHQVGHKSLLLVNERGSLVFEKQFRLNIRVSLEARGQDLLLNELEMLGEVKIAIGKELRIRRMVVLFLEVNQLLILQVGDELGLTT